MEMRENPFAQKIVRVYTLTRLFVMILAITFRVQKIFLTFETILRAPCMINKLYKVASGHAHKFSRHNLQDSVSALLGHGRLLDRLA